MSDTLFENFTHFIDPNVPSKEKLFFNLHIYAHHEGSIYYLTFFQNGAQVYLADRVLPGDTLINAIARTLKRDLGIDTWQFRSDTLFSDTAHDNKGVEVNRMNVYLDAPYFIDTDKHVAGMSMKWQLIDETVSEAYIPIVGTFPFKEQLPKPSPAVKTILDKIESILNQSRGATIKKLVPYVSREPKAGEVFAYFELYLYQNYGMNYNTVYVEDKKLDYDYNLIDEGESFLPQLNDYSENDEAYDYFLDHISQDDDRVYSQLLEKMLFEWFVNCWFEAGGEQCQIPTLFSFEKEYRVRDMSTGELMKESEAASRILGYAVS